MALWAARVVCVGLTLLAGWIYGRRVSPYDPVVEAGLPGAFLAVLAVCALATGTWLVRGKRRHRRWWKSALGTPQLLSVTVFFLFGAAAVGVERQNQPACLGISAFREGTASATAPYPEIIAAQRRALNQIAKPDAFAFSMDEAISIVDQVVRNLRGVPTGSAQQQTVLDSLTSSLGALRNALAKQAAAGAARDQGSADQADRDVDAANAAIDAARSAGDRLLRTCT